MDIEAFKSAFRLYPGGVALITADAGDGPVAMTATSVSSVGVEPPLLMFSVSGNSSSGPTLGRAETVIVHLLNAENLDLAKLGATSGIDRFADTSRWSRLETGEPVFEEAQAWLRTRVVERIEAAGSMVILAEAIECSLTPEEVDELTKTPALAYVNRTWHRLDDVSQL